MSNGINQIGIPKFQQPWRTLQVNRSSETWGDRGSGNKLQSALEKGLSWIGDKIANMDDYIEDGFNYLVTTPIAALTGKAKDIPRVIDQMREQRHNMSQNYAMNPIFDLVSPIKGGWMLKGLMKGSSLERQLSKTGTININSLQAYLNKASKLEQDVVGRLLNSRFHGQKNINYNELKKAVSEELISYSRKPQDRYSTYGMDKIGFDLKKEPDGAGSLVEYVPGIKTQTFTFESPRIYVGNGKHYDKTTLGHSRTYTTPDEPDVLHVMESQSDWGQNKMQAPYSGTTAYLNDPQAYRRFIDGHKRLLTKMQQSPQDYRKGAIEKQIANIQHHENILNYILNGPDIQDQYLHDNYLPRQLQENMIFAAEQGQKRMRYPTPDTAAKIEGYKKENRSQLLNLRRLIQKAQNDFEDGIIEYQEYDRLVNDLQNQMRTAQNSGEYRPEHQTILKKYADFPKMFNKLFKGKEVRTVTDPKGNTWYEVDIPEDFLNQEWQFKRGGKIGINNVIGL